ncbi:MAG: DUF4428 domain-containing protein [Lachnospiraceae bacterium]|nr:DUF4428 domain-containing protein [Lachnospiraceae bacterium]
MGLFDKKYCDICGNKIGLLGNKKLENGNMCKDCQRLLSPWFSERRHSTVEEIKTQLAYREANKEKVAAFTPTKIFGNQTKLLVDEGKGQFLVSRSSNWQSENPDVLTLAMLKGYDAAINQDKDELKTKDGDGKSVSYDPPRFEYEYEFKLNLHVEHPYFEEMRFEPFREVEEESVEVNGRPAVVHGEAYQETKTAFDALRQFLEGFCPCLSLEEPKEEVVADLSPLPVSPAVSAASAAPAAAENIPGRFEFPALPETVSQLLTLPGVSFHNPFSVAAMAVAAFCRFPADPEGCFAMIDTLKGPQPLSPMDKSFIKDRFMDGKDYVPRSYFEGAVPENDYTPNQPYAIRILESVHSRDQFDQGYITLYIKSGGADSERPVTLRHKPSTDEWFLWNHVGLLAGIRIPKSADPWA